MMLVIVKYAIKLTSLKMEKSSSFPFMGDAALGKHLVGSQQNHNSGANNYSEQYFKVIFMKSFCFF